MRVSICFLFALLTALAFGQISGGSSGGTSTPIDQLIQSGLLVDYHFNEGSGTTLVDSSGNANNGTYSGSITWVAGSYGANLSAGSGYAVASSAALATAQTIYIVYQQPSGYNNFNCVMGGSTGTSNLEILSQAVSTNSPFATLYPAGSQAQVPFPSQLVVMAVLIDSTGTQADRFFFNGVEVANNGTKSASKRSGTPWFGNSSSGHNYSGAIYRYASYSTYHTAAQIAANTFAITDALTRGGGPTAQSLNAAVTNVNLTCIGDSITAGTGGTPWPNQLSTLYTLQINNCGLPGTTAAQGALTAPNFGALYFAPLSPTNIATVLYGANDSGTTALLDIQNLAQTCLTLKRQGYKVIILTVLNQGASVAYPFGDTLNALIRANWRSFADEIADVAGDPVLGAAGAAGNATYFNTDHIHPTTAGYAVMASYVSAAINRLMSSPNATSAMGTLFNQAASSAVSITNTTSETSSVGLSALLSGGMNNVVLLGNTHTSTTIDGLSTSVPLIVGQPVTGSGVAANTTIATIASSTSITVNNATGTSLTGTELTFAGLPLKGNFWTPGKVIQLEQRGLLSTTGTPNLTKKFKLTNSAGTTTLCSTGAVAMPNGITALPYVVTITMTCISPGSSTTSSNGTFWIQGELRVQGAANGTYTVYPMTNASTVSFDTTLDALFDLTDTWGAASASNIDKATTLTVKALN